MSITAKANLPKLQVFGRVTSGLDSGRLKEWSRSSPGSTSRIVCNPRVRSSPAFSINLACRLRLSSISSVVAACAFRAGRFPLKPKRYLERGGLLDELIRSPTAQKPGLGYGRWSTDSSLKGDKVWYRGHDKEREMFAC